DSTTRLPADRHQRKIRPGPTGFAFGRRMLTHRLEIDGIRLVCISRVPAPTKSIEDRKEEVALPSVGEIQYFQEVRSSGRRERPALRTDSRRTGTNAGPSVS